MSETMIVNRPSSAGTPPNCAICLGNCTNKCYSNSCRHQFCFKCLLEWSRIKAECPLCKQPFKSIIHNIQSTEEFDEHVVETVRNEDVQMLGNEDLWFLPLPITPHRHEFHVRTTFTVDSRGEHAIQQMLLAHPLTAQGRLRVNTGFPRNGLFGPRHRRDYSATSFRRSIYRQNYWVNVLPDLSGRFRDCSPTFFRNNPAARQRLVPWLNRELNALLFENTPLIMRLVDIILHNLSLHHICSRSFRDMLRAYLDTKTDHFIHEFYSFMRSPFDMIGYDRNVIYTSRPQSPAPVLEDDPVEIPDNDTENDSDVVLVGESSPAQPVTIDLLESNTDVDDAISVSSGSELPLPQTTSTSPQPSQTPSPPNHQQPSSSTASSVSLPPKLRFKQLTMDERDKLRHRNRSRRTRSNDGSSTDTSDTEPRKETYRLYKRRKVLKKLKRKIESEHCSGSTTVHSSSETDDKPLIHLVHDSQKRSMVDWDIDDGGSSSGQLHPIDLSTPSSSRVTHPRFGDSNKSSASRRRDSAEPPHNGYYTAVRIFDGVDLTSPRSTKIRLVRTKSPPPSSTNADGSESSFSSIEYQLPSVKSEVVVRSDLPGPSTSRATGGSMGKCRMSYSSDSSDN